METFAAKPQSPLLKPFITTFWQVKGYPAYRTETIIPKGIIEIIFNFSYGTIPAQWTTGKMTLPKCFMNGFHTSQILMHVPHHHFFFGVSFRADAVRQLFSVPAGLFTNAPVDMTLIDNTVNTLWDQLAEAVSFNERVSVFSKWISRKSFVSSFKERALIDFLDHHPCGDYTSRALSEKMFYSPRQLSRKFVEMTGMNTEEILQYKKYLQSIGMMHGTPLSLSEIAHHCHFFDQSHFIRVFKSYADFTPGEYKKRMSFLPGHIFA